MLNWGDNWPLFPRTAVEVMSEIAARIGTTIDSRTILRPYTIDDRANRMTMREVAGHIAALHGGNWTITDTGELYLLPVSQNVELLGTDVTGEVILFGDVVLIV